MAEDTKQTKEDVKQKVEEAAPDATSQTIAATVAAVMAELDKRAESRPVTNIQTLYSLDKADYSDPTEELMALPELKRLAMDENYIIKWGLEMSRYQTADGQWYQEPRFVVELWRIPTEEEIADSTEKGGSLTKDTRIRVSQHMQFEDEATARDLATKLGKKVGQDFNDYDELMERMRFERIKKWLVDTLVPPKSDHGNVHAPKELAVGGTIVKVHQLDEGGLMVEGEKIL